jgi:chromosome segregation ATPase
MANRKKTTLELKQKEQLNTLQANYNQLDKDYTKSLIERRDLLGTIEQLNQKLTQNQSKLNQMESHNRNLISENRGLRKLIALGMRYVDN